MLVLERRERLGGACTLERPFPDERFVVSPCAYVVGLLDELVIYELELRRRGFQCYVADPNLWVPFEDGTALRPVARRRAHRSATCATSASSAKDIDGLLGLRAPVRRDPPRLRTGERDTWLGETPDPRRDRGAAAAASRR